MKELKQKNKLWDQFLKEWPINKLYEMTLDDYAKAGEKGTLTHWIESKLDKLGSIWGGSSFKFGVYSRKEKEEKENNKNYSYTDQYAWRTHLGSTAEEAFEQVKGSIIKIARMAQEGDLNGIQAEKVLGPSCKWKIAFHYQNRKEPKIINVFKQEALAAFAGNRSIKNRAKLNTLVLQKKPKDLDILAFGKQVWSEWEKKKIPIWKVAHSPSDFTPEELEALLANKKVVIKDSKKDSKKTNLEAISTGALFYLCHGNKIILLGKFTSKVRPSESKKGWHEREYEPLFSAIKSERYEHSSKYWTPLGNTFLYQVPDHYLLEFEENLLKPYFDLSLIDLSEKYLPKHRKKKTTERTNSNEAGDTDDDEEKTETADLDLNDDGFPFNRIYYGPPGTGKTYALVQLLRNYKESKEVETDQQPSPTAQRYSFVTFHQSYGYEEFVEGLRPVLEDENGNKSTDVRYKIKDGAFKKLCDKARRDPEQRYAMLIDEINRGNISKIFGELITLIEADKREGAEHGVSVRLPYSGKEFSIPPNVDIIGTMNTADRSLALLDTALRRRFEFVPLMPDTRDESGAPLSGVVVDTSSETIDIRLMLERINERIEVLYDRDHMIGHSYFMGLKDIDDKEERFTTLGRIFKNRIIPLLEEYFFEDWGKIALVLGDNKKPDNAQFIQKVATETRLQDLFGADELGLYTINEKYEINDDAFSTPEAYVGIYS